MRLYFNAESKNKVGYTPDWLKVSFDENGNRMELTLDIQGDIGYDIDCLSCRCKGDLIPWTLYNCETDEIVDLYSMSEEGIDSMFPDERIAQIICESEDYKIGIYPADDGECGEREVLERAKHDVISNGKGFFEMFVDDKCHEKEFEFETELNIY